MIYYTMLNDGLYLKWTWVCSQHLPVMKMEILHYEQLLIKKCLNNNQYFCWCDVYKILDEEINKLFVYRLHLFYFFHYSDCESMFNVASTFHLFVQMLNSFRLSDCYKKHHISYYQIRSSVMVDNQLNTGYHRQSMKKIQPTQKSLANTF